MPRFLATSLGGTPLASNFLGASQKTEYNAR